MRRFDFGEKVTRAAEAFTNGDVPYSFGGAIALGYYAELRQTYDIDINLYVAVEAEAQVMAALTPLGVEPLSDAKHRALARSGQVRLDWQGTPLDLFFSNLPFHDSCMTRRQIEMYGQSQIQVLGPEDLVVCKVAFGRPKDRDDIRRLFTAIGQELDIAYIRSWATELLAPEDHRLADFELALTEHGLGN
jgi:hypothetical protein